MRTDRENTKTVQTSIRTAEKFSQETGLSTPFRVQKRMVQRTEVIKILFFHQGGMYPGITTVFTAHPPAASF